METEKSQSPDDKIKLYAKAEAELKDSRLSYEPYVEGSLNKEIEDTHDQVISLQDDLISHEFKLPTSSLPGTQFLPQQGMISMSDDDDDVGFVQVNQHQDVKAVLSNGHVRLVDLSEGPLFNYSIITLDPHATVHSALKHKKFEATSL